MGVGRWVALQLIWHEDLGPMITSNFSNTGAFPFHDANIHFEVPGRALQAQIRFAQKLPATCGSRRILSRESLQVLDQLCKPFQEPVLICVLRSPNPSIVAKERMAAFCAIFQDCL